VENFDVGAVEKSAEVGAPVDLAFFGATHRLLLEPCSLRARGFHVRSGSLDGDRAIVASHPRTFKGHVQGEPNSMVRLSIGPSGIRGCIKSSEGWAFIQPLNTAGDHLNNQPAQAAQGLTSHKVFTEGDLDQRFEGLCAEPLSLDSSAGTAVDAVSAVQQPSPSTNAVTSSAGDLRVLQVAADADVEFFAAYGSGSATEIESILNIVDGIYQANLGLTIELVSVHIWDAEPDPYSSTDSGTLLNELRAYWNANNDGISRDVTHLFTGKELDGSTVGIAYVSVVCSTSVAYALSQDLGSAVLVPLLVAHEIGHNLGANHDAVGSSPRYIMYPSLGFSNLDEFSQLSKDDISSYTNGVTCLGSQGGNISNPPGGSGKGGGGGGGGPVDPVLIAVLALAAWKTLAWRKIHRA